VLVLLGAIAEAARLAGPFGPGDPRARRPRPAVGQMAWWRPTGGVRKNSVKTRPGAAHPRGPRDRRRYLKRPARRCDVARAVRDPVIKPRTTRDDDEFRVGGQRHAGRARHQPDRGRRAGATTDPEGHLHADPRRNPEATDRRHARAGDRRSRRWPAAPGSAIGRGGNADQGARREARGAKRGCDGDRERARARRADAPCGGEAIGTELVAETQTLAAASSGWPITCSSPGG